MSILQMATPVGLASVLAKTTLLLGVGSCCALLLRRAPAGARHLVWLIVIGGVLLIPAMARVAPVRVAVLPSGADNAAPVVNASASRTAVAPSVSAAHPEPAHDVGIGEAYGSPFWLPYAATLAIGLWLGVAGALLGWLFVGILSVRRIQRTARVLDSPDWTGALRDAASRLHLTTLPRLLASDDVDMAFACDVLAPAIVLPSSADGWSDDRRRAVLLHELAHVRRRDLVGHTIARVACAVYWFHPWVWIAAHRLRAESEQACDDLVLTCGMPPNDYARLLLDMVAGLRHRQGAPASALPMARRNDFEGRLLAILDCANRRRTMGRVQGRVLAGVLGLVTLSTAAALPVPRAPRTSAGRTMPRAVLSDATVASLLRYGTAGIINPMLMILRDADSLGLSARQADSIATLNRWYMVRLSAIWSPVARYYAAHSDQSPTDPSYGRAPASSMDLLAALAPDINTLLTADQRRKLPNRIAAYLDRRNLAAIGAGRSGGPAGVFAPDDQSHGGQRGRGRRGGRGL